MRKYLASLLLGLSVLLLGGGAQAASINFVVGDGSRVVVEDGFWNGSVKTRINPALAGTTFSLAPGESRTIDFFDIYFKPCVVVCGGVAGFQATLDLLSPDIDVVGEGEGWAASLFGFLTIGSLQWSDQPLQFSTSAGTFSVLFHDLKGVALGKWHTVQATITAIGGAVVPLPAAVWLFGSALLALVGVDLRRRRLRVRA